MTPRSDIGTGFAQTSWTKNSHGWIFLIDLIGIDGMVRKTNRMNYWRNLLLSERGRPLYNRMSSRIHFVGECLEDA